MGTTPRIAVAAFFTECNHFSTPGVSYADFEATELHRGEAVLKAPTGAVGGMLAVLRERGASAVPLLVASAVCGGPVVADAYRRIKGELLERLAAALPVEGVLLSLHGSMTIEDVGDPEGDLLTAVRALVGERVPIVASLDHHAHVTREMVEQADGLVAWETYPHRDTDNTGRRAASLLLDTAAGRVRPVMALAKAPVIVSGVHGHTDGPGPFADVMRLAKSFEKLPGVVSTAAFLVHPYLDLPDMGGGGLVITDGDKKLAVELATRLADAYWKRRFGLEPEVFTPAEAIRRGAAIEGGPILLVETADCCGGGAAGDSVHTLRALLDAKVQEPSLVPVVDPEAAARCHDAGAGTEVSLELGHKLDPAWGKPLGVRGKVLRLSDGDFVYSGGIWAGMHKSMGPTAVLEIGSVRVLIMSKPTYDWKDEQFRSVGLDAASSKFVVVKNPMNFRFAYAGLSKAAFILDTPGPTPATLKHVAFRRLRRPYFPADSEIFGLSFSEYVHESACGLGR
ncbi:MAG: M81 family metallopeptidase [Planctomycetes bacterium]|nr:M81 family metallopeptidase [Planctomycetota bacterium]